MKLFDVKAPAQRLYLYVFIGLFAAFAAFASGLYNYNVFSRIGLTANLVQHGRVDIEGYAELTADRAQVDGKYYSDKAPGMSFLAVPAAFAFTRVMPVSGDVDPSGADPGGRKLSLLIYFCTVLTSGLLTALAGTMLFAHVRRATGNWTAAGVATAAYALGTPTWAWATSFFGHAAAGATLVMGFLLLEQAIAASGRKRLTAAILAGVSLGAAVSIEFTAAIAVALIMGFAGFRALGVSRNFQQSLILILVAGAAAALTQIPLLAYNAAAFGSPFKLGYSNVVGWEGMKQGIFGIGAPDMGALGEIVLGLRRGVLWLSPVLALAVAAAVLMMRRPGERLAGGAILSVTAFYLLMNAGYAYWDGGFSTGPRHITPLFPFLALALGLWFARAAQPWRIAILVALGASVLINLMVVSVETMADAEIASPLTELIAPAFVAGDLRQSMVQVVLGAHGLWQLLPLFAVWGVLGWLASREFRRERAIGLQPASA